MTVATQDFSPVNIEERKNIHLRAGDTVRVHQRIEEKGKVRLQVFEGMVLSVKHGTEAGATFTVRRVTGGVGVERIFPLYSPAIDKIEIVKRAKTRRAKLYYIREKVAREIRRQMRGARFMDVSTESETEQAAKRKEEAEQAEKEQQEAEVAEAKAKEEEEKKAKEAEEAAQKEEEEKEEAAGESEEKPEGEETNEEENKEGK